MGRGIFIWREKGRREGEKKERKKQGREKRKNQV